ncbi:acyltransferase [Phycicoccus sp. HDW14]|uniref:acyltransferase family protein n=1 Tax=Phycicoccus sp. HDW14 TaxID=2714941 RepID=UPI00140B828D|nr:acyltransferase [Phycicoccus sp. HDW14]QIM21241.1 acyltransferase [Phycicoccus sp. HDW14]
METTTRRPALPALTGLRALAAGWVVVFHYREELLTLQPALAPLDTLMRAGYLGVDLFFALSGFVLAYTYADRMRSFRRGDSARFVRNRFARVWPVHVLALHVDLALAALVGTLGTTTEGIRRTGGAYLENLGMVHYWVNDRPSFNSPAWSISAEWFAYLLAPLLFVLVARLRRAGSALALAGASYAVMLGIYATMALPNGNLENMFWVRIMGEFLAGVLLCLAWTRGRARLGGLAVLLPVTVAVVALVPEASGGHYWAAPALGLGVAGLAASSGTLVRVLSWRWVVAAGEASYALYMVHWLFERPIEWATGLAAGDPWASTLVLVAVVGVLGATAHLVATRVEQPARRRLVGRPRRKPAPKPAVPPATEVPERPAHALAALR